MKSIVLRYFAFSKNYGAAFGIFSGQVKLIILLTFFAIGFLVYYSKDINRYVLIQICQKGGFHYRRAMHSAEH